MNKWMGWSLMVSIWLLMTSMSGCAQKVDGIYQGHTTFWGRPTFWKMKIDNDAAIAISSSKYNQPFRVNVSHEADRIVIKDAKGRQIAFNIKNNGKTLECTQCEAVSLPTAWEKEAAGAEDRINVCEQAIRRMSELTAPSDSKSRSAKEIHEDAMRDPGVLTSFQSCVFKDISFAEAKCVLLAETMEKADECSRKVSR